MVIYYQEIQPKIVLQIMNLNTRLAFLAAFTGTSFVQVTQIWLRGETYHGYADHIHFEASTRQFHEPLGLERGLDHRQDDEAPHHHDILMGHVLPGANGVTVLENWMPVSSQYQKFIEICLSADPVAACKLNYGDLLLQGFHDFQYYQVAAEALIKGNFDYLAGHVHVLNEHLGIDHMIDSLSRNLSMPEVWASFEDACVRAGAHSRLFRHEHIQAEVPQLVGVLN
jgi:hypothetical protein